MTSHIYQSHIQANFKPRSPYISTWHGTPRDHAIPREGDENLFIVASFASEVWLSFRRPSLLR
jgi:hypothetical protein